MSIHGWNALRRTISILKTNDGISILGPVFDLNINPLCPSGVNFFSCTRKFNDGKWVYDIVDQSQRAPLGYRSPVYWLPWADGRSQQIQTPSLNNSGVDIFITSRMSGCHFIGCEKSVAHVAPNAGNNNRDSPASYAFKQMYEVLEDSGVDSQKIINKFMLSPINNVDNMIPTTSKFVYGGGEHPPRACVIGIKHNDEWIFAYQEQTFQNANYAKWYMLN
jgi:hypothetical protein